MNLKTVLVIITIGMKIIMATVQEYLKKTNKLSLMKNYFNGLIKLVNYS